MLTGNICRDFFFLAFSLTTAPQFLMCEKLLGVTKFTDVFLDFFEVLWYNILVNKISRRSDGRAFRGDDLWGVWLTTVLTIYRVGLRGNSADKSTRKH